MADIPEFNRHDTLRNHLRSGVTPGQFEMDILRYEKLRSDAALIGATRLRWPEWLRFSRLASRLQGMSPPLVSAPKVRTRQA